LGSIFEGIAALKTDGPTEEQAAAAKETLLRQFETDFQENGPWLNQLVSDYQRGVEPAAATDTFNESVRALTTESIRLAAERYLDTANYVRVTLLPE
jgi:zinc protease